MNRKRRSQEFNIPDDLLVEILMRLPIKTLGQLRCVSQPWNSLISTPFFVANYQYRRPNSSVISAYVLLRNMNFYLCREDHSAFHQFIFQTRRQNGSLRFLDSINGVACLASAYSSNTVILFNPAIHHYVEITDSTLLHEVWDETCSLGFGFEDHGFKVVRFGNPFDATLKSRRNKIFYEVYSTKNGAWRKGVGRETIFLTKVVSKNGVFSNGKIHWVVSTYDPVKDLESLELLMFDCKGVDFAAEKLPLEIYHVDDKWGKSLLSKCQEKLSIMVNNGEWIELWVREEYGFASSWKKQDMQNCYHPRMDLAMEDTLYLLDSPEAKPISVSDRENRVLELF